MKAEREKWSGRVTAKALRFQTGQYELAEELSLVHAQGGEPVPLEQEEELTRTERKRFSDVLDAHVLESRAGEHGTELVIGGVKPERLERFRSILDAYKSEDQSMETIQ